MAKSVKVGLPIISYRSSFDSENVYLLSGYMQEKAILSFSGWSKDPGPANGGGIPRLFSSGKVEMPGDKDIQLLSSRLCMRSQQCEYNKF